MVIRKNCFGDALYWYQKKISTYDQQQWEKKLEERMSNGIHIDVACKVAKLKTELIDLDLIRGSTFSKAKPKQSWLTSSYFGIVRVCLFPFYLQWWIEQSNRAVSFGLLVLYFLQMSAMFIYFSCDQLNNSDKFQTIPLSELISPLIMFFILGSIHSQITAGSLISLKNKHLNKNNGSSSSSPNNNVSSHTTSAKQNNKYNFKEDSKRNTRVVSKVISKVDECSGLRTSNANKKVFANKANANTSGLRKRKLMSLSNHKSITLKRKNVSLDQFLNLEATSGDDLSPYSTFHGELNNRLDHLLSRQEQSDLLQLNDENSLASIAHHRSLHVPLDRLSKKSKSTNSSASASLSNFSTDASACKVELNEMDGKRSKEIQCELSSSESDRGMPPSPIKVINDWPMINSDCSSDEDDDDDDVDDLDAHSKDSNEARDEDLECNQTDLFAHDKNAMVLQDQKQGRSLSIESELKTAKTHFKGDNSGELAKEDNQLGLLANKVEQTDRISCSIYQNNEWRKLELSVLDISSIVIRKVASHTHSNEYFYLGICCSLLLAIMPQIFRLQQNCPVLGLSSNVSSISTDGPQLSSSVNETILNTNSLPLQSIVLGSVSTCGSISASNSTKELIEFLHFLPFIVFDLVFNIFSNPTYTWQMQYIVIVAFLQRFFLSLLFFFFLCVAERTFRERLLYAKHFSHMTSARRAKKAELPHFRLNKVRNIKCWLSVRSYLKRHGPQRSVNCIVSTCFILAVTILTFLCIQLLKEAEICTGKLYCYEMVFWNMAIGVYIMRLIILGSKINRKYRSNMSVLLTEQINLYLKLEQKPHKKEELTLANNVLKLACSLIKELEVPFKISGFSANPYLYNITKVIVLSAFSSLLSEILGFKLKLTKIKLSG